MTCHLQQLYALNKQPYQFYKQLGVSLLQSLFFRSTALVVDGQRDQTSLFIAEKVTESILRWLLRVHHCAQFLAIDQLHSPSMKSASSVEHKHGICSSRPLTGRTPHSVSKHAIISTELCSLVMLLDIFRNMCRSLCLSVDDATLSAMRWQERCQ